jgi:antitoxin component of RelBE/YafQ-DinJ toxin-antitoxin module
MITDIFYSLQFSIYQKKSNVNYVIISDMTTTSISIKITKEKKEKALEVARELGVSLDSLVNEALNDVIEKKGTMYRVKDEEPSPYLKRVLKKAEENYKKGNTSPAFKTGEEAVAWLEKQGI